MKLFGWLSKLLISTVIISTLSVLTAGYVVNLYVEEIFRQYQLPGIGKKIQFSDIAARLSEELNISKPKGEQSALSETQKGLDAIKNSGGASNQGNAAPSSQNGSSNPIANSSGHSANQPSGVKESSNASTDSSASTTQVDSSKPAESKPEAGKDDAVAVWGQVNKENASSENKAQKDLVISTEEFAKKKDLLTSEDKMKIFSLVVSKLPQNEVQYLSTLLEGGITAGEMKEVDQILQKYLKKEEYQQLFDILSKY